MPTITQLEYLLAVDQERHFGKAAKECFVSQPSLSAQIQKLEETLGVIIFDRSKKPILATEAGKEIIEQAKVVIREHKKIQILADLKSSEPKGKFELAVIPSLATYLIPLFIGGFAQKYPHVDLKINEYKTEDIVKMLNNDEIDAGLLVTPLDDERLIERHLFYEPFFCFLNQNHQLCHKTELSGADLTAGDLWLLAEGHCFRDQVLKVCSSDEKQRVLPNVRFESGSLDTLIKLVKANSGFTLLPQLAVNELSQNEISVHIKRFKDPIPTREVSLVYSRSFLKEKIIQALEETILDNLPPQVRSLKRQNIEVVALQ